MEMQERLRDFLTEYENDLQRLAEKLRGEKLPPLTEELFSLYEKTGNRLQYEDVYFSRRKFLTVFGAAACLYRNEEDIRKLERVIEEICAEECWALPAHVFRDASPDWRITVDLFAAETAQCLAEIFHILADALGEETRKLIRREVFRRVLDPFLATEVYPRWEKNESNWNAVCCGSVGCAVAYLIEDAGLRGACLQRLISAIEKGYLKGFGDDGACMEGISYWTYGVSYYMMFADILEKTGSPAVLAKTEKIRRIAMFQQACFFPCGRTVSFSDGDRKSKYRMGLTSYLACHFVDENGESFVRIPDISCAARLEEDTCWRWAAAYRDVIWTRELLHELEAGLVNVHDAEENYGRTLFCDAQWAIWRARNNISIAAKAGTNSEPHNHNDVGSFFYLAGEDEVLCDLGCGEYTKDYFGKKRYTIFCNSSESHNVPVVDGRFQKEGRCGASFSADEEKVSIEFAGAYGNQELKCLTRSLYFDEESGRLTVRDCFEALEKLPLTEQLVTQLPVEVSGTRIKLSGTGYETEISVEGIEGEIRTCQRIHRNHSGRDEDVTVIQWDVPWQEERLHTETTFYIETERKK